MNNKRQTIWLVSMLSIMVILSAYYLFTEPAGSKTKNQAAENQQLNPTNLGATEVTINEVENPDLSGADPLTPNTDKTSATGSSTDTSDKATTNDLPKSEDKATINPDKNNAAKDQEVLKKINSQGISSKDMMTSKQQERNESYMQQMEKLNAIVNDMEKSPEEAGKASQELTKLEDKEQKINSLEEDLQKEFGNAVIQEENDKYTIVVASDKLQVSEAVSIVDKIIKELNVTQDKVSVQRVTP